MIADSSLVVFDKKTKKCQKNSNVLGIATEKEKDQHFEKLPIEEKKELSREEYEKAIRAIYEEK